MIGLKVPVDGIEPVNNDNGVPVPAADIVAWLLKNGVATHPLGPKAAAKELEPRLKAWMNTYKKGGTD